MAQRITALQAAGPDELTKRLSATQRRAADAIVRSQAARHQAGMASEAYFGEHHSNSEALGTAYDAAQEEEERSGAERDALLEELGDLEIARDALEEPGTSRSQRTPTSVRLWRTREGCSRFG